jgi:CMP-N,N'-diacetyllegionaminic acid synthase
MLKTIAIIPARSGSQSLPDKNILLFKGRPMLAWSIEHALLCPEIDRVIVSTDSIAYASIAESFGAEVPFLRPAHLSDNLSTDYEVFQHALSELAKQDYVPELIVHLRPTTPIRNVIDISKMINMLYQNKDWDSIRSVVKAPETPFKMWIIKDGLLKPTSFINEIREPYNSPRQILPSAFLQNASIDVTRSKTINDLKSMTGYNIGPYIMENYLDIDEPSDYINASLIDFSNCNNKTFCINIDVIILHTLQNKKYTTAIPNNSNIQKINKLFDLGNIIILTSNRSAKSKVNWNEITQEKIKSWGVRYHQLYFGMPEADYYLDVKAIELSQLINWKM